MAFDTASIIKLFTNNKFRLIALILVLIFLGAITFVKVYYSTDDCKPLIEQNSSLMEQNSKIIQKNSELVDNLLKIQNLLGTATRDTVYVSTTETVKYQDKYQISYVIDPDSNGVVSNGMQVPSSPIKTIQKSTKLKPGNHSEVMAEINKIIEKSVVK